MQGQLRQEHLTIRIETECGHCHKPLHLEVDGELNYSVQETDATRWILITSNQAFLANPDVKGAISPWSRDDSRRLVFTDDYSNLFSLLKR